jgi:phosphomannomutase
LLVVRNVYEISIREAFYNKRRSYSFEINESFIDKYQKGIKYYVDRLRGGATAGVRGKTDVEFRNPESGAYEYISGTNETKLDYKDAKVGDLEGGEINIAMTAFLAQAYAEFLKDKISRKPSLSSKTLVGFDTRYFSKEIGEIITRVLAGNGFQVFRNKRNKPSPTPVNSLLTYALGCVGSLNVTASHNSADQNGIKPNNEKGHLDSDDDLEIFLSFVEKLYSEGKGSGIIKIAPLGNNVRKTDFLNAYLKEFISPMMDDGFLDLTLIQRAMDKGWGFVIDGIGGTGGVMMDGILNNLFADSWKKTIRIINKKYDPNMLGIPKPDPTIPVVMEKSGLLRAMSLNPNITAGGTGDNDWDRFTAAISIDEDDIPKAKRAGLNISSKTLTPLAQFTADQMYTFFGDYQLRRTAQEKYYQLKGR